MKRVAIVGPGRMGTLLAAAATNAGMRVVAVAGGSTAARERLRGLVAGVRVHDSPDEAARAADLVLLCVPDDALEDVATQLAVAGGLGPGQRLVHVAGSRGRAPLRRAAMAGARVAACHPAMTAASGAADPELLHGVAWAVTAVREDRGWAHEFVTRLGGDPHDVPEEMRTLYHAGLAVASNAVGAALVTARRLLLAAGVRDATAFLGPLAEASAHNVLQDGASALTGPIVRGDLGTVSRHLAAIDRDLPELATAYRALAQATLEPIRGTLPLDVQRRFDELLTHREG